MSFISSVHALSILFQMQKKISFLNLHTRHNENNLAIALLWMPQAMQRQHSTVKLTRILEWIPTMWHSSNQQPVCNVIQMWQRKIINEARVYSMIHSLPYSVFNQMWWKMFVIVVSLCNVPFDYFSVALNRFFMSADRTDSISSHVMYDFILKLRFRYFICVPFFSLQLIVFSNPIRLYLFSIYLLRTFTNKKVERFGIERNCNKSTLLFRSLAVSLCHPYFWTQGFYFSHTYLNLQ